MGALKTKSSPDRSCVLGGDIGGTKTNLGLFTMAGGRLRAHATETFSSREARCLEDIVSQMFERHPARITVACFGVAGPVVNGECRTTNLPWVVSEKKLRQRFGFSQLRLINDLSATALAVPWLESRDVFSLNRTRSQKKQPIGLVAPGTGLGQALLVYAGDRYMPVASEGGHADFAPTDSEQIDLWRFLQERFGHVSVERVLSGQGLVHIYEWLKLRETVPESSFVNDAMRSSDPARVITENAIKGKDPLCRETLQYFCRIFGAVAGNLALTGVTLGGMFLGGGIPPKILSALEEGGFMETFTAKGRFETFMKRIPVRVVLNEKAALLGAARHAFELERS